MLKSNRQEFCAARVKVVFDTNILVSGFLWNGPQARLLDAGLESRLVVFTTGAYAQVIQRRDDPSGNYGSPSTPR